MVGAQTWKDQTERRYQLGRDQAARVLAAVTRALPRVVYTPGSERTLVVTTYLDTPERYYFQRATPEQSIKLRVREYLAIMAGEEVVATDECFLERKQRDGAHRLKQRIHAAKAAITDIVEGLAPVPGSSPEAAALRAELAAHGARPAMVSAYERIVFGADDGLRVTFDERIGFYTPPAGLYRATHALSPDVLGDPHAAGPARVLEVKYPDADALPPWLAAALADVAESPTYSKFVNGMRALQSSSGRVRLTNRLEPGNR